MKFMAKNRVDKKVPPIFIFWVVLYMPCQFDKFDNNTKKKYEHNKSVALSLADVAAMKWFDPIYELFRYTFKIVNYIVP